MATTVSAFRLAGRRLAQAPGSSLLAVLALGLGIGLTTAAFSLLDAVFLRGLPLAWGLCRALAAALYGVSAFDLASYAAAAVTLGAAGLAASLGPALRAAQSDPAVVLRHG